MDKLVLSAENLLEDSFRLGAKILEDGFEPTLIIAIWRGGTPVGMAVQELMGYFGIDADHIAIRTSSYAGVDQRNSVVKVYGLNYVINKIAHTDRVLIVDDVFDTGHTIAAVVKELRARARDNMPDQVRVGVPWYKPTRNETDMTPDYWIHETSQWLVFPHELDALTLQEMEEQRPELHSVIAPAKLASAGSVSSS